jgi:hypothetical protein
MSIQTLKLELAEARAHLNRVLDAVGDRWDTQIYADKAAWTAGQLLTHLAISDQGQSNTVMAVAKGEELVPADFDIDRYNKRSVEKRAEMTPAEARKMLDDTRASFNDWLDHQDEATLDLTGRHGSLNVYSIAEFLQVMAAHERAHADDIARVLAIPV